MITILLQLQVATANPEMIKLQKLENSGMNCSLK